MGRNVVLFGCFFRALKRSEHRMFMYHSFINFILLNLFQMLSLMPSFFLLYSLHILMENVDYGNMNGKDAKCFSS